MQLSLVVCLRPYSYFVLVSVRDACGSLTCGNERQKGLRTRVAESGWPYFYQESSRKVFGSVVLWRQVYGSLSR